jgi:hypothetical protein
LETTGDNCFISSKTATTKRATEGRRRPAVDARGNQRERERALDNMSRGKSPWTSRQESEEGPEEEENAALSPSSHFFAATLALMLNHLRRGDTPTEGSLTGPPQQPDRYRLVQELDPTRIDRLAGGEAKRFVWTAKDTVHATPSLPRPLSLTLLSAEPATLSSLKSTPAVPGRAKRSRSGGVLASHRSAIELLPLRPSLIPAQLIQSPSSTHFFFQMRTASKRQSQEFGTCGISRTEGLSYCLSSVLQSQSSKKTALLPSFLLSSSSPPSTPRPRLSSHGPRRWRRSGRHHFERGSDSWKCADFSLFSSFGGAAH